MGNGLPLTGLELDIVNGLQASSTWPSRAGESFWGGKHSTLKPERSFGFTLVPHQILSVMSGGDRMLCIIFCTITL